MGLRKFMDKIKPAFSKGGKLGFLESTFDAFETFLSFRTRRRPAARTSATPTT